MATNVTRSQAGAAAAAVGKEAARPDTAGSSKAAGFGLPCAKCHLYYPANLNECPTCKHKERVAAVTPKLPARPAQNGAEATPDNAVLEREREEFLRQFKSQMQQAHAEVVQATESVCKFGERHAGEAAPAEICAACYERLQERLDICEASLHIDLKEAAQIIYDAVWADPSDPNKTYQNAAGALLTELRKRAGVAAVRGPFEQLKD